MLTIFGKPDGKRFCDGLSRRSFLQIGGLAMGGMALPQILRAETAGGTSPGGAKSHKGIIMVFLPGGPPHQDMWDLKMNAPREIRGEFQPIKTKVPGIEICELFPRIAGMMDKFVPIRSIVGARDNHYAYQCLTGRHKSDTAPQGRLALSGLGALEAARADRPLGAALRRPVAQDGAHALGR